MRLDRHMYFIEIARLVAKRSTCNRAQVGAVLVSDKRIVATGYNGSPPGGRHCIDVGCLMHEGHCIRTSHAEVNALLSLEHPYEDLVMYCTHQPCAECYKLLTMAGVRAVYFVSEYEDPKRNLLVKDFYESGCHKPALVQL